MSEKSEAIAWPWPHAKWSLQDIRDFIHHIDCTGAAAAPEVQIIRHLVDLLNESEATLSYYAAVKNYIAGHGPVRSARILDDAGTRARAQLVYYKTPLRSRIKKQGETHAAQSD